MSEKEEFTEGLKAFEAQLASLVPRTDRLDHQRLIFLAGQQSVAAGARRPAPVGRWAWPTAFTAMTAVAATLAVMLLSRPESPPAAPVLETAPVEQARSDRTIPDRTRQAQVAPEYDPGQPSPESEPAFPESEPLVPESDRGVGLLASIGSPWLRGPGGHPVSKEFSYTRLRDRVLAQGLESWPVLDSTGQAKGTSDAASYRELLDGLLHDRS